ncbi:MAG: ATP-binding protein [Treponema sp.]|nr:ATP-binding protein [Treponema sp.]
MGHTNLGDIVIDIAQNAASSGADLVELEIWERPDREFRFTLRDNGRGMSGERLEAVRKAAADYVKAGVEPPAASRQGTPPTPSRRGTPPILSRRGLGIPFMALAAFGSGGGWELKSEEGRGTEVSAWFGLAPGAAQKAGFLPPGDISGTVRTVLLFEGPEEVLVRRKRDGGKEALEYEVRKTELVRVLGDLRKGEALVLVEKYLRSIEP